MMNEEAILGGVNNSIYTVKDQGYCKSGQIIPWVAPLEEHFTDLEL